MRCADAISQVAAVLGCSKCTRPEGRRHLGQPAPLRGRPSPLKRPPPFFSNLGAFWPCSALKTLNVVNLSPATQGTAYGHTNALKRPSAKGFPPTHPIGGLPSGVGAGVSRFFTKGSPHPPPTRSRSSPNLVREI